MGGSYISRAKLFLDSARARHERKIRDMERVCSEDPTPALGKRMEDERARGGRRLERLQKEHERFGRMMSQSDAELSARSSAERSGPLIGEPGPCRKIAGRKMGEKEYVELTEGPTLILRRTEKNQ
ncbi:MAG: hypothetical protein AB1324_00520 [Candidatus Micrarchaeota archaeon]